jgi:hypothetical protein
MSYTCVACGLPVAQNEQHPKATGSRHRDQAACDRAKAGRNEALGIKEANDVR